MSLPMSPAQQTVAALHRYPVKSMMGESLNSTEVGTRGLLHDRSFAPRRPIERQSRQREEPGQMACPVRISRRPRPRQR